MTAGPPSTAELWSQARSSIARFLEFLVVGRVFGLEAPDADEVRRSVARLARIDTMSFADDAHRLDAAHRMVADRLHRLPEQQIRLDDGWRGVSAGPALTALIEHQQRAEDDLAVLRTGAEATNAAAAGIDRLMRTFLVAVGRVGAPSIAGTPAAGLPEAVLTGRLPVAVVVADIAARVALFESTVHVTTSGIEDALALLNSSTGAGGGRSGATDIGHADLVRPGDTAADRRAAPQGEPGEPAAHDSRRSGSADAREPTAAGPGAGSGSTPDDIADIPLRLGPPTPGAEMVAPDGDGGEGDETGRTTPQTTGGRRSAGTDDAAPGEGRAQPRPSTADSGGAATGRTDTGSADGGRADGAGTDRGREPIGDGDLAMAGDQ